MKAEMNTFLLLLIKTIGANIHARNWLTMAVMKIMVGKIKTMFEMKIME
jgi:hypothetical protein